MDDFDEIVHRLILRNENSKSIFKNILELGPDHCNIQHRIPFNDVVTSQSDKMHTLNYLFFYWKPFFWSFVFLLITCLTNQLFELPINGIYLMGYVTFIAIATTWVSFVALQSFLQKNKPLDITTFIKIMKYEEETNMTISNCIKQLCIDIDTNFIRKWFVYISNDRTFNEESQMILEEILEKIVNVQLSLDNQSIVHGVLNLYLKHLKEFRRGLKRREKYGGKLGDLYRYSHICSSSKKARDYYIHQLTLNLLNHFINWELSNSLPYRILASTISKKFVTYILNILCNPAFLNYYILYLGASEAKKRELKLETYNRIEIMNITENSDSSPVKINTSPVNILEQNLLKSEIPTRDTNVENSTLLDTKIEKRTPTEMTYREIEDVKIYEPKSCKTWYDSYDLDSVTMGQDILDIINVGDTTDGMGNGKEESIMSPISSAKNLLDEVKHITSLEGIKTSMKPISDATLLNIKDLQESTVNHVVKPVSQVTSTAFHKIGGLHLQDEAAGVMEGLLDYGRTKIRKGLRLTGLQDESNDEIRSSHKKTNNILETTNAQDRNDEFETTWINPLQDDLIGEGKMVHKVPSILTHEDSPEPEYEEAADLATSIAKLRSLLEQKSSESNLSTPALSPMPPDDLSNKILLESGLDETDGVMPSFYKFCAKTATGVIHNTLKNIKTALPGNVTDCDRFDGNERWLFVEGDFSENDIFVRMHKLLCERKVFCTVDTAYEAIDSLEENGKQSMSIQFEDELDDFEVKLPVIKTLLDILCELLADTKETFLTQEPVIKSAMLLLGNLFEEKIVNQSHSLIYYYWINNPKIPSETKAATLSLDLDNFIKILLSDIPDCFKYLIGERVLVDAATLLVSSLQVQRINQDMMLQIFEIICLKLMDGSKQISPVSA